MKKIILLISVLLFLSGCVTTIPLKVGKPIEVKGTNAFNRHYEQEGKILDLTDLFDKLGAKEATREKTNKAKYMFYGSMALSGVGGYLIGYNLVSNSSSRSNDMMTGVLLVGAGFGLGYYADQNLSDAIQSYNQSLGVGKKKNGYRFQLIPYAINDRAGLGLHFTF